MHVVWLWFRVASADPVPGITVEGRAVLLADDGTWRYTDGAQAPPNVERIGAWTVDLATTPVSGAVRGGASTPNLDGPGVLGLICNGNHATPVVLFSEHALDEIQILDIPFTGEGAYRFADRKRPRVLRGPRVFLGTLEGYLPAPVDLLELLERQPRTELVGENDRPGRFGFPATIRYSLDGFAAAWNRVDAACRAVRR